MDRTDGVLVCLLVSRGMVANALVVRGSGEWWWWSHDDISDWRDLDGGDGDHRRCAHMGIHG